jgi:hypothetical protein
MGGVITVIVGDPHPPSARRHFTGHGDIAAQVD